MKKVENAQAWTSVCCGAEAVINISPDFIGDKVEDLKGGTCCFICSKCKKPCDADFMKGVVKRFETKFKQKQNKINVIILCGGQNLRMGGEPKCLTFVNGKTVFEWELEWLKKNVPINKIVAMIGTNTYLRDYFARFGVMCFTEEEPLGDAGAIKSALECLADVKGEALVMNGDTVFDFNFAGFLETFLENPNLLGGVVVKPFRSHLGILEIKTTGGYWGITSFKEKPLVDYCYHSCGVYLLRNKAILPLLPQKGDFAGKVLSKHFKKFFAYIINENDWIAVESKKDILKAEKMLEEER